MPGGRCCSKAGSNGRRCHLPLPTWILRLAVDIDQVSALSEDRERLWAQVAGADFLTLEEKRMAVGLENGRE